MRSRVMEVVNHVDKVGAAPSQLSRNPGCGAGGGGVQPGGGTVSWVSRELGSVFGPCVP